MIQAKQIFILIALIFSMSPLKALAFMTADEVEGMQGCAQDCKSCHTLSIEEAGKLLKADQFKITITEVTDAPIKGIYLIKGLSQGKQIQVYLDYAKKTLIQGKFEYIKLEELGKKPALPKMEITDELFEGTVLMGNKKGKYKMVVFDDPDCPYCKKLHPELKKVLDQRKDVAIYIKLFPLVSLHPKAYEKSKAILCADSAKMLDDALNGKKVPAATCETNQVDKNIAFATRNGIGGTPRIVLPDGSMLPGYTTANIILMALDDSINRLKEEKKNNKKKNKKK